MVARLVVRQVLHRCPVTLQPDGGDFAEFVERLVLKNNAAARRRVPALPQPARATMKRGFSKQLDKANVSSWIKKYLMVLSSVLRCFLLSQMFFRPVTEQLASGGRAGPCHAQLRVLMKSLTQRSPGGQRQSRWRKTCLLQLRFAFPVLLPCGLLPGEAASSQSRSITSAHEERRISMVTAQSLRSKRSTSA